MRRGRDLSSASDEERRPFQDGGVGFWGRCPAAQEGQWRHSAAGWISAVCADGGRERSASSKAFLQFYMEFAENLKESDRLKATVIYQAYLTLSHAPFDPP